MEDATKCVVVGDTGVGKTRLICAKVNKQRMTLKQLMVVHRPTVWAQDPSRLYNETIDGLQVNYSLWDTFGEHKNDRCFAYSRSLEHAKTKWYPEVKKFCPQAAVVLVACKSDLRYLYFYPEFRKLKKERPHWIKLIQMDDVVTPVEGRAVAKEIDAFYFETSIFTWRGVEEVFENAIRLVLLKFRRSKLRLPSRPLLIKPPKMQKPELWQKPSHPKTATFCPSKLNDDLCSAFCHDQSSADLLITCDDNRSFSCHRLLLSAASRTFYQIFVKNRCNVDVNGISVTIDIQDAQGVDENSKSVQLLIHCVNGEVMFLALHFCYHGALGFSEESALIDNRKLDELISLAKILCFQELDIYLTNLKNNESFLNEKIKEQFLAQRNDRLIKLGLERGLFADVELFAEDDVSLPAHKFVLINRCEFMRLMFNNKCQETCSSKIKLPDVSSSVCSNFLRYLYGERISDACSVADYLSILELSNRFCLWSLKKFAEIKIVSKLNEEHIYRHLDDAAIILEQAQLINAKYLTKWCLYHLSTNYKLLSEESLKKLSTCNQNYLKSHCWPPNWYFDECEFYDFLNSNKLTKTNPGEKVVKCSKLKHYFNEITCFKPVY